MSNEATMLAAVFERVGVLSIKAVPVPTLQTPDDVLIRVEAVSICGTDVRALSDPPEFLFKEGIVIGHECAGIVSAVGSNVTNVGVGDKVVVHPNIGCGKCYYCRTGKVNLCENFQHIGDRIDGAMAEFLRVPEKVVYKISHDVPSHIACLAEPLACVLNGTTTVRIHPGETAVVLGSGPIGLIYSLLYKAAGARVIVSEVSEKRRALARSVGADFVVDPSGGDLEQEVKKITGAGADVVVDAVGFLLSDAIGVTKKGGHILLFGVNERVPTTLIQNRIIQNEITVHGIYIAKGTFPAAVQILENDVIPIEKLVSNRLPLREVKKGIEMMRSGESAKVVIDISR